MLWRICLAAFLTLCIATFAINAPRAQFNGCQPGFCTTVPVSTGEATVQIDVGTSGTLSQNGALNTSTTFSGATPINVGSGPNGTSNMVLLAALGFCGTAAGTSSSPSMTWDNGGTNQAMTLLPTTNHIGNSDAGDVYVFYLINPTHGAKVFSASWTTNNQVALAAASFVNVDQTGGATTFPTIQTNTGASGTSTVSISTTPTTRAFFAGFSTGTTFTTPPTGTDLGKFNSCNDGSTAAAYDAGTATSMSYSVAGTGHPFAAIATAIKGH